MFEDNTLEKMMELGIGLSVMRQMPGMMEGMMPQFNNKTSAQTPPSLPQNEVVTYIAVNGQQAGPLSEEELKVLIANNVLTAETLVWTPQLSQWTAAKLVPSVNKLLLLSKTNNEALGQSPIDNDSARRNDVIAAVAHLGYNNANTRKVVDEVIASEPSISVSDAVKEVLKRL